MKKRLSGLCVTVLMIFCLAAQTSAAAITLSQPSATKPTLAPLRDFMVIGHFEDIDVPADVRVELYDHKNNLLRRVTSQVDKISGITGKEQLNLNYKSGKYYVYDDNASLIANPPPDLVAGADGKQFKNPANKAVVNREREFAALLLGGISKHFDTDYSDPQIGSYRDLKPGNYLLKVYAVNANDGSIIAEIKRKLTVRGNENIVFGRFSPDEASGYAHKEKLSAFADSLQARLLRDSLPGYWSRAATDELPEVFYEIPQRWRVNDAQEYLTAHKVHGVIYNISESSTSQGVEIGALLANDLIDNPQKKEPSVSFYYYDLGDIELEYLERGRGSVQADGQIVPFPADGNGYKQNVVTRVEIRPSSLVTAENEYWPKDKQKYVDFKIEDGVEITQGEYISIFGVTTPIRTADVMKAKEDDSFAASSYLVNNRIMYIKYEITTPSGAEIEVVKPVGLKRHYFVNKIARSIYEYKHILGCDVLNQIGSYKVQMQGLDKQGQTVDRSAAEFIVRVK